MKYRKKPVVVEAKRCDDSTTPAEIASWCGGKACGVGDLSAKQWVEIPTLEGTMRADYGDYIIKGVKGEFYPCKPDIFVSTYEPVPHQKIEAQPAIPAPLIEIIARLIALFGPEEQHWMYAKLEQVHMESLANIRQHSNGAEPQGEITPFECALGLSKCSFGVSSGYCEQCCE